ncbi:MAG: site-specific integrase, partial [Actinobacteria bacterium]|nr:site-specific integrase [Actinomycetota bacterium]
ERRRKTAAGFASRKDAEAAMNKILAAIEEQRYVIPAKISVREFLTHEWLPAIKATLRPTTYASYQMHVLCHILPALGAELLARLRPAQINAFYATLLENGRLQGSGSLSPATVRRIHATLHRALRDAIRWQLIAVNPADAADPPRGSGKQRELPAWDAGQLASFLSFAAEDRLFALWRLLAMTGARRGEALGLRWDDLDLEHNTITIRRALVTVNGTTIVSEPKTSRGRRRIALDPLSIEALKAHAARQADESGSPGWTESGYIFTTKDGGALEPRWVSKQFGRLLRVAALPRIPLHGLRHTYATLALSSGVNPRIVSGRLGHSTVALTLDIYSHVLPQADADAAERIAALVER